MGKNRTVHVNRYENDPVKAKARDEIYKFADKYLPKDRLNATALYFASNNQEESKLLDRLGIPRDRRVILEADSSKLDEVRQANTDVRVIHSRSGNYFKSDDIKRYAPLWYCGLDYECMFGEDVSEELLSLANNSLLKDGGVLYTNLVGQREQSEQKGNYLVDFFRATLDNPDLMKELFGYGFDYNKVVNKIIDSEEFSRDLHQKFPKIKGMRVGDQEMHEICVALEKRFVSEIPEDKLDQLRSLAVHVGVRDSLVHIPIGPLLYTDVTCPGTDRIAEEITGIRSHYEEDLSEGALCGKRIGTLMKQIVDSARDAQGKVRELSRAIQNNSLTYYRKGGLSLLPLVIQNTLNRGYVVTDESLFSYTSNKNTRMLLDIMKVRDIRPLAHETYEEMVEKDLFVFYSPKRPYLGRNLRINPDIGFKVDKKIKTSIDMGWERVKEESARHQNWLSKRAGDLIHFDREFRSRKLHIRRSLGSSFKIPIRLSTARECVQQGLSDEAISEKYQVGPKAWRRIAALRANQTKGYLKSATGDPIEQPSKNESREIQRGPVLPGSKFLVSRNKHAILPEEYRQRIDYFRQEVVNDLPTRKQLHLRKAFYESNLDSLIDPSRISPVRFYAFFDDVTSALRNGERIDGPILKSMYLTVRDSPTLLEKVKNDHLAQPERTKVAKKSNVPEKIKDEIRELAQAGFSRDELWESYKTYFSSRQQFGAVVAWASPNLAKKRAQ